MMDSSHYHDHLKGLVLKTVKTIVNQFHRKQDIFFNEHDFHHYCYHSFYKQKEFSELHETKDGKRTNILRPEYPTQEKFTRKPIQAGIGVRGHYDMAILDPSFIQKNNFVVVRGRDIKELEGIKKSGQKTLIAALEFKFIISHQKSYIEEIRFDNCKLFNAHEAVMKYALIFSNTKEKVIDYIDKAGFGMDIRALYVIRDSQKWGIKIHPDNWLGVSKKDMNSMKNILEGNI